MRHGIKALLDPPVRAVAVVYINGKRAGSLWHPPYRLDVTALLHPGSNTLEVKVANTAINHLSGEDLPNYRLLWARYGKRFEPQDMDQLEPVASGLMGPIELIRTSSQ